ncbi:MAG: hypothetical protein ACREOR_12125 [Candidatus Binatia bacterium]
MASAVIVAALAIAAWFLFPRDAAPPPTPGPNETRATNPPAAVTVAKPDFQKLKGQWLRPDGGYVIEIKSVDDSGKMDAAYFNPKPIHVAKAEASRDGATTKVFLELRDVNYPGSTYTLVYVPQSDQLKGIYYQAARQQNFEVFFVRAK